MVGAPREAGGDEAGLWARDLLGIYEKYAAAKGWKVDPLELAEPRLGERVAVLDVDRARAVLGVVGQLVAVLVPQDQVVVVDAQKGVEPVSRRMLEWAAAR